MAIQEGRPSEALDAWRGFFWLTDRDAPSGMAVDPASVAGLFAKGLANAAALAEQIALERLLIRGGFVIEARRFDTAHGVAGRAGGLAVYRPITVYFRLRDELAEAALTFNRASALGGGDGDKYQASVTAILGRAARDLAPGAADPDPVLRDAFGLYGILGMTGGYASLHEGHLVQDEEMAVSQFGRTGQVRFIAIDNMLANGFQSWLWDGDASAGGWSSPGAIIQVRGAYTPSVIFALDNLTPRDPAAAKAKLAAQEAQDLTLAGPGKPVFLPGLQTRLMSETRDAVAEAARAQARASGAAFERVFVKLYWDALLDQSILAHEGRHALDGVEYPGDRALDQPELEFRAKLSELELSHYPKLGLSGIMALNIGDATPHGIANARVIGGLAAWMALHRGEIAGLDPAAPLLTQLDKLSDAQLRAAARSMDPEPANHAG